MLNVDNYFNSSKQTKTLIETLELLLVPLQQGHLLHQTGAIHIQFHVFTHKSITKPATTD